MIKMKLLKRRESLLMNVLRLLTRNLGNTEEKLETFKRNAGLTDISSDAQLAVSGNAEYERKG